MANFYHAEKMEPMYHVTLEYLTAVDVNDLVVDLEMHIRTGKASQICKDLYSYLTEKVLQIEADLDELMSSNNLPEIPRKKARK